MKREISIKDLQCATYGVKDNSVRGFTTKSKEDVKPGDEVVLDNHFTLVTE